MRARCMKKGLVFLLQKFSLVVQDRECIRVRGFHLVFPPVSDDFYIDAPFKSSRTFSHGTAYP